VQPSFLLGHFKNGANGAQEHFQVDQQQDGNWQKEPNDFGQ